MIIDINKIRYAVLPELLGATGLLVIYDGRLGWGISNNGNTAVYDLSRVIMPIALFVNTDTPLFQEELAKDFFNVSSQAQKQVGDFTFGATESDKKLVAEFWTNLPFPVPEFPNATLTKKGTKGTTLNFENMDAAIKQSWIMPENMLKLFYDDLSAKDLPDLPNVGHIKSDPAVEAAMMKNVLYSLNYFLNTIENG